MDQITAISRTPSIQSLSIATNEPERRCGAAGAIVAGAAGGFLGLSAGATGVAQRYRNMGLALPKPVSFLATCGRGWAPAVRGALGGLSRGTAAVLGPWSAMVTRFPDKLADLYGCMAGGFDTALAKRIPGTPYPPECVQLPLPGCPNPGAYRVADTAAPWIYAVAYAGVGIGLAGSIGLHAWRRFGPQDVIARCEDFIAQGDPEKTFVSGLIKTCDPCGLVRATEIGVNRGLINLAKRRVEARQTATLRNQPLLPPTTAGSQAV